MFSKATERRSIASQLVVLFTVAAALLLCCGLGVFYWMVVRHAFEEDNAVLADKISAVGADLKSDGPKAVEAELKNARDHTAFWIRVLDSGSAVVTETPGMNGLFPPHIFPTAQPHSRTLQRPKDHRMDGQLFSLLAVPVETNNQAYTIQIAQDRSTDEQFTREFGLLLAVVLALGIPASAIIATTVTRRGLRPLTEMAHTLEGIGPTHLNERVAPVGWPRELQPLAASFDEMLVRLEQSFTRLSQFSADLAHELRTPVANIRGEAEVALTRPRPAEEYREVIESIAGECQRLSGMIDKLLFLARSETGRGDIQAALFSARAEIEKMASFYETLAEEQHITISCLGEGEVYADPMLFGRALSNLVENALRFTPPGGTISISITTGPAYAEISVKDTGSGIAKEDVPRVFDRFFRGDSSRSSHGTGLGLALVKSITDLHGGSATVESELGRGTTVTLRFPKGNA